MQRPEAEKVSSDRTVLPGTTPSSDVSPASGPTAQDLYVEVNRAMSAINGSGALLITALVVIAIWGEWRALTIVAMIQVPVIAFNIWVNLVYLPRAGRFAEVVRTTVNLSTGVIVNHVAHWPTPVWLWLPFVALAFDHLDRRVAKWSLIGICVVQSGAALLDGVSWIYPVTFTLFAVFCSEVSRVRFSIIRDMLVRSDRQRGELEKAHESLREAHEQLTVATKGRLEAERELRQAQKLEAVGRLAAGVAHEINTPVQFVGDSLHFLRDASHDLLGVVESLQAVRSSAIAGTSSRAAVAESQRCEEDADLAYLLENMPKAFDRALDGLSRVATIVRSMKEFAHPDSKEMTTVDLNRAIESTLTIARNEYKYVADLEKELGELPPVRCHVGDLNQAILNIVVNAAHAIGDVVKDTPERGRIRVRTWQDGSAAVISISDTGGGIPEAVRERVFDPFFTTKEVGKGTGQGLAIARSVVVEKHGGELTFETEAGVGTTFLIRLPIEGRESAAESTEGVAA